MDDDWQQYKAKGEQAATERNYPAAEANWAMAVIVAQEFGEQDPRLSFSLDHLGHCLLKDKKLELAERVLTRSWRIKYGMLGPRHREVAHTVNLVAEVYYHQARYNEAEPLCELVQQVFQETYGDKHPYTVLATNNLASLKSVIAAKAKETIAAAPKLTLSGPQTAAETAAQAAAQAGAHAAAQVAAQAAAQVAHPTAPSTSHSGMPAQNPSTSNSGMPAQDANPDRTRFGMPSAQTVLGSAGGIYVQPAANANPGANPGTSQTNLQRQSGMQIPSVAELKQQPKKKVKPKCEQCGAEMEYGDCQRCTGTVQAFRPGDQRLT